LFSLLAVPNGGLGREASKGVGVDARPSPGMRTARGETNFGGGSEGERFLRRWSAVFGLCAEP
jgi:hypothetical protein